jgi:hypothetical protein
MPEQMVKQNTIFVRHFIVDGADAPARPEFLSLEQTKRDVGIANVNRQ